MMETYYVRNGNEMNFRKLLLDLSQELNSRDVKALKFLLADRIPGSKLEHVASGLDLFELLVESEMMSLSLLAKLMRMIGRLDLLQRFLRNHTEAASDFSDGHGRQNMKLSTVRTQLFKVAEQMTINMVEEAKFIENLTRRDDITDGLDFFDYLVKEKPICNVQEIPKILKDHHGLFHMYRDLSGRTDDSNGSLSMDSQDVSGLYKERMSSLFPSHDSPTFPNEYSKSTRLVIHQPYETRTLLNGIFAELREGVYKEKPVIVKSLTAAQRKDLQMSVYLRHPFLLSVIRAEINNESNMSTLERVNLVYCMEFKTSIRLTDFLHNPQASPEQDREKRIRILYQVSDALHFLHTHVEHLRGPVVHMNVRPCSILVDKFYNALLGDSDIAVEIPDEATHLSVDGYGVYGYTDPYKEIERQKKPSDDIFSLGIVILQVLKWQPSSEMLPQKWTLFDRISKLVSDQLARSFTEFTKDAVAAVALTEDFIDTNIWETGRGIEKRVGEVALQCLLHPDHRINASECMSTFKNILVNNYFWCKLWDCDDEEKCIQCHFYDKSDVLKITSDICTEQCAFYNRFCRECHYFSFRNALHCPMHETVYPMIGSPKNFVILITGYSHDSSEMRAFQKDVDYVRRTVTDPRIMNIRLENLLEVRKGKIEKMSDLEEQVKRKMQGQVDFLFVYYSGHGSGDSSVCVSDDQDSEDGGDNLIVLARLRELLGRIKFKRLLVLFDCCHAGSMNLNPSRLPDGWEWMMILYSSDAQNYARSNTNDGSIFTRYFVAGLQSSRICLCENKTDGAKRSKDGACPALQAFRAKAAQTGFIELHSLVEYMIDSKHGSILQKPVKYFQEKRLCSDKSAAVIAYYNNDLVTYNFRFIDPVEKVEIPVQLEQIDYSATSLEAAVICRLRKEIGEYVESIKISNSSDFRLETETGIEVKTVEKFKMQAQRNECFRVFLKENTS